MRTLFTRGVTLALLVGLLVYQHATGGLAGIGSPVERANAQDAPDPQACGGFSSIGSNFNGTPIAGGH